VAAVLFGSALGDAYAAEMEFVTDRSELLALLPPAGQLGPGRVTDDTQMMLAVGRALATCEALTPETATGALISEFVAWLHDPENTRAPGMTCMRAARDLAGLRPGRPWQTASQPESKGCGANMRVQPAAFIQDPWARAGFAQLQAALTHGHPTALAAADLTAEALHLLLAGLDPRELIGALIRHTHTQRTTYHHDWLGNLWTRGARAHTPEAFIETGWAECEAALERVPPALHHLEDDTDPCDLTGDGWTAEDLLSTALLCFLSSPRDLEAALRRAAVTGGDSDSLACLTGALVGAHAGMDALPVDWAGHVEGSAELTRVSQMLGDWKSTQEDDMQERTPPTPPVRLFVDDERDPAFLLRLRDRGEQIDPDGPWTVVRTQWAAQAHLLAHGLPDLISFDHDYGPPEAGDGHGLAKWMVDQALDGRLDLNGLRYQVHSQNPIGRQNIEGVLDGYLRFLERG